MGGGRYRNDDGADVAKICHDRAAELGGGGMGVIGIGIHDAGDFDAGNLGGTKVVAPHDACADNG